MSQPILVAYATKRESTHEVADAVAARLRELGLEVDVRPRHEVGRWSPTRGVVLGGALYTGRWHRDARRFLASHRDELAQPPARGVRDGAAQARAAEDVDGSRQQLDRALAKEPELVPVSVAIFGGVIDPAKLRFPFTRMDAADARDWDAIRVVGRRARRAVRGAAAA